MSDSSSSQAAEISVQPVRRLITETRNGRSVLIEDQASPYTMPIPGMPGMVVTQVWNTAQPASAAAPDPCALPVKAKPPAGGSTFLITDFPPDTNWLGKVDYEVIMSRMGVKSSKELGLQSLHPFMHVTATIDYAIVLEGEVWAVLDDSETLMRAGDVLVQRATHHAWSNRSNKNCRMAFVLIDAPAAP